MDANQQMVQDFHRTFNLFISPKPSASIPVKERYLSVNLIKEEVQELEDAVTEENIVEIADALGDLLYVVYGAALRFGIDLEPVMREIHRSNMTKVKGTLRDDGKVLKPPTYSPANLQPILESQSQ